MIAAMRRMFSGTAAFYLGIRTVNGLASVSVSDSPAARRRSRGGLLKIEATPTKNQRRAAQESGQTGLGVRRGLHVCGGWEVTIFAGAYETVTEKAAPA